MTITIDQAGRIVVPKTLRERFGLCSGTELEIEATGEGFSLRPSNREPAFVEKEGILVHHGPRVAGDIDIAAFINHQREARALSGAGLEGL
jgi:AbrB family looped-hinge helix DNA binding protein